MRFHRVSALLLRHLYLYKRSFPRLMDIFYWPVMELLVWGFLSVYLEKTQAAGVNIATILLGGIIFWDLLSRSQQAVSISFLEDVWERNFLNLFVSPLSITEFLASTFFVGVIRIILVGIVASILAVLLYQFNIFIFGLYLVPFVINLFFFGWTLGLFTTGIILRYGTSAQILAFGFIFLIQPFSAVFYPISAMPGWAQWIAYIIPSSYVFEGMREVIATGTLGVANLSAAFLTNFFYLALVLWFFYRMFARVKVKGLLLKLD
ncbi:MAG: ABC transporter permease [Candidatus Liptonbacteria bacterium]|nr:ABC transporter permease [Candidatus Liptonbacteria bacterium]